MKAWARRHLAPDLIVAAVLLAIFFAAVFGAERIIATSSEAEAVAGAMKLAERDARVLVEYWTGVQERITGLHLMAQAVTEADRAGDSAEMNQALDGLRLALSASMPGLAHVSGIDPQGFVSWSTWSNQDIPLPIYDLNDRDYVQAILLHGREHFTGRPVVGKLSGKRTIQFAVAQRSRQGALIGISLVSFDLARAENLAKEITRHNRDRVTLLRNDRMVLARSDGRATGMIVPGARNIALPDGGSMIAARRGASRIDGVSRIIVRLPVPGSDLEVAVGLDEAVALASATIFQNRLRIGAFIVCFLATLLAGALLAVWRQAHRAQENSARYGLLHEIAERSNDMIGVLDSRFHFVFLNHSCSKLLGTEPSQLIGKPAGGPLPHEYRQEIRTRLLSIMGTKQSVRFTAPNLTTDNKIIWLEYDACWIRIGSHHGAAQEGWLFIARDVTARKVAEMELQQAHEDLRTVAENSPGVLYRTAGLKDGRRNILYASKNIQQLLGYDDKIWRMTGFVHSHLHPADMERKEQFITDLIRNETAVGEYRLRHKDGHYIWFRNSATCIRKPDGTYLSSGYAQDVTQEKEQAVKLEEARRMLSLGQLASGIGHELGQPLAAIGFAADSAIMLLQRGASGIEPALKNLSRIASLIQRAGSIIHNMRFFGQSETQNITRAQITDLVAGALDVMQERLDRENISIRVQMPATLPAVLVPALLFQQVLINLIGNACDAYMDTRHPETDGRTIRIEAQTDSGQIRLQVMDQAGGVHPDMIGHIFEPFFTTKGPDKGTGLGLAVCYGIVRQAGGRLSVRNEAGGAVFEILLPACGEAEKDESAVLVVPA